MSRLVDEGSPLARAWRPFEPSLESAKQAAHHRRVEQEREQAFAERRRDELAEWHDEH